MSERHPGIIEPPVSLDPPTEELKLSGTPIVDSKETGKSYSVHLPLNRALTVFEFDAVGKRQTNAGLVYAHHQDRKKITVVNTTLEAVRDWLDELKQTVRDIAAGGEQLRAESAATLERIQRESDVNKAEAARRAEVAKSITLD